MTSDFVATYELSAEETPTEGVVQALATAADAHPLDLQPLYHALDPEALDILFTAASPDSQSDDHVTFVYEGYLVTFHSKGRVTVASNAADRSEAGYRNAVDQAE